MQMRPQAVMLKNGKARPNKDWRTVGLLSLLALMLCGCGEDEKPAASINTKSNASVNAQQQVDAASPQPNVSSVTSLPEATGLTAPPGFRVTQFAGDDLAHNVTSMTIDAQGRVVVSGPGFIRTLHDDDADGAADRATNFCEYPGSGAHGMLFLGNDLLCNGDGGLRLLRDADGDGRWDGSATREEWMKVNHPEHGANGLVQGPDGWIYMICGNDAGVTPQHATSDTSPIHEHVGGTLLRISPDGSQTQIVAHGFRNPYDIDFTQEANVLTVDSDGERDQYLPWYSPTRMFDIAIGQQHGWLLRGWQRSWNRPESFFDNVQRLAELGRGSPTGLVVYRHHQFPEEYRNSALSACWTLGRVYHIPLVNDGASYERAEPQIFLQTKGSVGFAPVDLAVGPDGDLFVAIGGRGTQGGVFRVSYVGDAETNNVASSASPQQQPAESSITEVLDAPQPLTSWSRANWVPAARQLGVKAFEDVVTDETQSAARRQRAIEILSEVFGGPSMNVADEIAYESKVPEVRAHMAWALGRMAPAETPRAQAKYDMLLAEFTYDESPNVARHAWESLLVRNPELGGNRASDSGSNNAASNNNGPTLNWISAARSSRRVCNAMLAYVASLDSDVDAVSWLSKAAISDSVTRAAVLRIEAPAEDITETLDLFAEAGGGTLQLTALRLIQISLGDLELADNKIPSADGYVAATPDVVPHEQRVAAANSLQAAFQSGDAEIDRELARTIALLNVPASEFVDKLAENQQWTSESAVVDDLHYLMAAARILEVDDQPTVEPAAVSAMAAAFVRLHGKLDARWHIASRNWPNRVGELADRISKQVPGLSAAIVEHSEFGRVEHELFVSRMQGDVRISGVRKLLNTTLGQDPRFATDYEGWTPRLVSLLRHLPIEESAPHLNAAWEEFALQDAVLPLIASSPAEEHRAKYVTALHSIQPRIVEQALDALLEISAANVGSQQLQDPQELAGVLSALRQACLAPRQLELRRKLVELFEHSANTKFNITEEERPSENSADVSAETARLLKLYDPCFAWFAEKFPQQAAQGNNVFSASAWQDRLAAIDWSTGDVASGEAYYRRKACHRCHDGASGLGPDLRGAAARFSREDLFAAIVDPNRDVAPLYQTTLIETADGQIHVGLIVYESPEGTLIQTSADEVIRISDTEVLSTQRSRRSLMPQGLLDDATDDNLADLDAYLRSLTLEQ